MKPSTFQPERDLQSALMSQIKSLIHFLLYMVILHVVWVSSS